MNIEFIWYFFEIDLLFDLFLYYIKIIKFDFYVVRINIVLLKYIYNYVFFRNNLIVIKFYYVLI